MEENLIVGFYPRPFKHMYREAGIKAVLQSFGSDVFKSKILIARDLYAKKEYEKYTLFKNNLPALTFSGIFSPTRTAANINKYSGIIVMDVDKVGDGNKILISKLSIDKYVLSAWLSPSGDGIKFLILNGLQPKDHKDIYKGAVEYFNLTYGIKLDTSGSDMSRLCFVSYDPDIKFNFNCEPFIQIPIKEVIVKQKKSAPTIVFVKNTQFQDRFKNDEISKRTLKKILHYLQKRALSITDTHENWIRVAYAISNTFNYNTGISYFLDLCRLDGVRHNEELSDKLIKTCYGGGTSQSSFATILYIAQEKGYDVGFNAKVNVKKKKSVNK